MGQQHTIQTDFMPMNDHPSYDPNIQLTPKQVTGPQNPSKRNLVNKNVVNSVGGNQGALRFRRQLITNKQNQLNTNRDKSNGRGNGNGQQMTINMKS